MLDGQTTYLRKEMTQGYNNFLVDPDPFFEDWMSTSPVETEPNTTDDDNNNNNNNNNDGSDSNDLNNNDNINNSMEESHVIVVAEDEDDDLDEVTILSSVSSASRPMLQFALEEESNVAREAPFFMASMEDSLSFSSHVSSLPSSQLDRLPSVATTVASLEEEEEEETTPTISTAASVSSLDSSVQDLNFGSDAFSAHGGDVLEESPNDTSRELISEDRSEPHDNHRLEEWLSSMKTEQDWEMWRNEIMSLEPIWNHSQDRDQSLIQFLVQQEEIYQDMVLQQRRQKQQQDRLWYWCGIALLGWGALTAITLSTTTRNRSPFKA